MTPKTEPDPTEQLDEELPVEEVVEQKTAACPMCTNQAPLVRENVISCSRCGVFKLGEKF